MFFFKGDCFWRQISTTLIFILFCSYLSEAQILVGPTLGGQFNRYVFDDKELKDLYNLKGDFNFNGGLSLAFRANKNFFLHTSFLYTQKSKNLTGILDQSLSNRATLKYIDVPILYTAEFTSKLGKDKVFKWYLGIGPTISYWLGGKGLLLSGDLNENIINPPNYDLPYKIVFNRDSARTNEMNVKSPNRIQLGLNLSVGLILEPMKGHRVLTNLRYGFGQSFLSRDGKGEFGYPGILYYTDELKVRNQELVLSLHYFIDLQTDQRKKGKSTSKVRKGKSRN